VTVSRHEWRLFRDQSSDGTVGEIVTFDEHGVETARRRLRHRPNAGART
jgi:hypothetical protein